MKELKNLLKKALRLFKEYILEVFDYIFPRSLFEERLSSMTPSFLLENCSRPDKTSGIRAIFSYGDPTIKNIIWFLKYKGNDKASLLLAEVLYEEILEDIFEDRALGGANKVLLVPIPISKERRRERGFNQMEKIIENIFLISNGEFKIDFEILEKIKDTKPQTSMRKRRDRLSNLDGAFRVSKKEKVEGENIILLDDVTTTGATMKNARKELLLAGARKVICLAVAH